MTDLELLKQFLGLEIEQSKRGIMIRQHKYALEIIINFKRVEFIASKCPFLPGIKLGEFGDSPLVDCSLYMKLVGSLLYLTHSKHYLEYDVKVL